MVFMISYQLHSTSYQAVVIARLVNFVGISSHIVGSYGLTDYHF